MDLAQPATSHLLAGAEPVYRAWGDVRHIPHMQDAGRGDRLSSAHLGDPEVGTGTVGKLPYGQNGSIPKHALANHHNPDVAIQAKKEEESSSTRRAGPFVT